MGVMAVKVWVAGPEPWSPGLEVGERGACGLQRGEDDWKTGAVGYATPIRVW